MGMFQRLIFYEKSFKVILVLILRGFERCSLSLTSAFVSLELHLTELLFGRADF